VVGVARDDSSSIVSMLTERQFRVTLADTYARARERLAAGPPTLLITEIRLAEYNGLQLVLHGKVLRPSMAAVALSCVEDPVLQSATEALGATFVVTPVSDVELAAAVFRTIFNPGKAGGPIRPPFERRSAERRRADRAIETERRQSGRRMTGR
jgi:response regulator RpfG family c-di-GMP phosphodiesterase